MSIVETQLSKIIAIQEFFESNCGSSDTSNEDSRSSAFSDLPIERGMFRAELEVGHQKSENNSRVPFGTPLSTALNMVHLPSEIASINELGDRIDSIEQLPVLQKKESFLTKDSGKQKSQKNLDSIIHQKEPCSVEHRCRMSSCAY